LVQKSASTSSGDIAGARPICRTLGSNPRADQAASSAVALASSTESSSAGRQENLEPAAGDGESTAGEAISKLARSLSLIFDHIHMHMADEEHAKFL
jgi:hypothetical protein